MRTVLIVAKKAARREALVRAHETFGDRVFPAATAHEARRMANFHAIDLAVVEPDGFEEIESVMTLLQVEPRPAEVRFSDDLRARPGSAASSASRPSARRRRAG